MVVDDRATRRGPRTACAGVSPPRTSGSAFVPGAVRASLGLYNTTADVDALVEGLHAIAAGEYQRAYELEASTGEYLPSGWFPDFGEFFSATRATGPIAEVRTTKYRRASA